MKNSPLVSRKFYLLASICCILLTSCLSNAGSEFDSAVQVALQAKGLKSGTAADSIFIAGDDSLTVTSLRLIHGNSFFGLQSDTLRLGAGMLTLKNRSGLSRASNPVVFGRGSGQGVAGSYVFLDFKISQASDTLTNVDPGFIKNGKRYSIIVKGTYNSDDFTFKSQKNFERKLTFTPVDVPEKNASVLFLVSSSISSWFRDGAGFLDPSKSDNKSAINTNIENSLTIDVRQQGQ